MRAVIMVVGLLMSMTCAAAQEGVCKDQFEIAIGAKPMGSGFWISAPKPYVVELPAHVSTSVEGVAFGAHIKRLSDEAVLVEYTFETAAEGRSVALVSVPLPVRSPKSFKGEVIDQLGNSWSFAARSTCGREA